ncbi:MAG: TadE/TadG family type IV pilus assembly protein [Parvularculaceae bacterium]
MLKLLKNTAGSAAVEFALVLPAFLVMMFSTFEVGWFYFANSQVDAATVEASRFIRTGRAQKQGYDKDAFFDAVCPSLELFGDCQDRLTVEVQTFASFADLAADNTPVTCRNDDPQDVLDIPYEPGLDNQIVRLRLCLIYNTINPTIGVNVSDTAGGQRRLYGSYLFRNEPFSRNQAV